MKKKKATRHHANKLGPIDHKIKQEPIKETVIAILAVACIGLLIALHRAYFN